MFSQFIFMLTIGVEVLQQDRCFKNMCVHYVANQRSFFVLSWHLVIFGTFTEQ